MLTTSAGNLWHGLFHHACSKGSQAFRDAVCDLAEEYVEVLEADGASSNLKLAAHFLEKYPNSTFTP